MEGAKPLLGRERERRRLSAMQARAAAGRASAVLYVGASGVGKTALLQSFERQAQGAAILIPGDDRRLAGTSAGVAGLLALPFQRRPIRRATLHLLDPLWDRDPPEAAAAAAAILACAAATGPIPLIYLVDDLDEIDEAGRAAVAALVDAAASEPVVVVATSGRPLPEWPGRSVRLPPLPDEVILDLLVGEGIHRAVAEPLVCLVAGSPLAAHALAGSLTPDQRAGMDPLPDSLPVDPTLVAMSAAELEVLPPAARRHLLTGSVMTWFGHVCEEDPAPGGAAGPRPRRATLLREAMLAAASPDERRRAHDDASEITIGEVSLLHRAAAARLPDDGLAASLVVAAEDRLADGELLPAIELLLAGGDVALDPSVTGSAWYRAAVGSYLTGRNRRVLELAAALRAVPGAEVPTAHLDRLEGLAGLHLRGLDHTIDQMAAGAERARRDGEPAAALTLLLIAGVFSLYGCRVDQLSKFADQADALEVTDPVARATVRVFSASADLYTRFDPSALRELAPALAGLAEAPPSAALPDLDIDASRSRFFAGLLFLTDEQWERALALLATVAAHDRDAGWTALVGLDAAWHAEALWRVGSWSEAIEVARTALEPAQPALGRSQLWLNAFLAKAELLTGNTEAAAEYRTAVEADSASPLRIPLVELSMRAGTAVGLLGAGDPEGALEHLVEAASIADDFGHPGLVWWRADLVEALAAAGRRDDAAAAADSLRDRTGGGVPPVLRGRMLRARGLAVGGRRGLTLLARAATTHEASGCPFERGRSLLALAEARDALGDDAPLVEATAIRAHDLFDRLGAVSFAARAQRVGTGPVAADQLAALTAREAEVARVVAAGATNDQAARKLGMSPKTVSFHLGSVFRKLRVTSRSQLAAAFRHNPNSS